MITRILPAFALAAALAAPAAFAAPEPPPPPHEHGGHGGPEAAHLTPEDVKAFADARIAALKAGLQLTPAQEKNWPGLETALRDIGRDRLARAAEAHAAHKPGERPDALEALRRRARNTHAAATDLEKLASAAAPLYETLDEGQKRRFGPLLHRAHGWGPHEGPGHEHQPE